MAWRSEKGSRELLILGRAQRLLLTKLATAESEFKNLLSTTKNFLSSIEGSTFFTCHNH